MGSPPNRDHDRLSTRRYWNRNPVGEEPQLDIGETLQFNQNLILV
jgi:hypothetical protein